MIKAILERADWSTFDIIADRLRTYNNLEWDWTDREATRRGLGPEIGKTKWPPIESFKFCSFFSMAKNSKQSNDREFFDTFFPGLVDDIVKENENDKETGDAVRHMREVSKLKLKLINS